MVYLSLNDTGTPSSVVDAYNKYVTTLLDPLEALFLEEVVEAGSAVLLRALLVAEGSTYYSGVRHMDSCSISELNPVLKNGPLNVSCVDST